MALVGGYHTYINWLYLPKPLFFLYLCRTHTSLSKNRPPPKPYDYHMLSCMIVPIKVAIWVPTPPCLRPWHDRQVLSNIKATRARVAKAPLRVSCNSEFNITEVHPEQLGSTKKGELSASFSASKKGAECLVVWLGAASIILIVKVNFIQFLCLHQRVGSISCHWSTSLDNSSRARVDVHCLIMFQGPQGPPPLV